MNSLTQVLARGARVHYVVGNSMFYDVPLPTEEIYAAMFEAEGLTNATVERIRKRTSKKELFEYTVHARPSDPRHRPRHPRAASYRPLGLPACHADPARFATVLL